MFKIGDYVFHPMHGVGVVESIETHNVLGKESGYYMLRFINKRMTAMVPVESSEEIGVRPMMTPDEYERAMEYLERDIEVREYDNWGQRYNENMDKLKSGNILSLVEVILSLKRLEHVKGGLSSGEKKMLNTVRQAFLGELTYVSGRPEEDFVERLGEQKII